MCGTAAANSRPDTRQEPLASEQDAALATAHSTRARCQLFSWLWRHARNPRAETCRVPPGWCLQATACTYRIALGPRAGQQVLSLRTVAGRNEKNTTQTCAPQRRASACMPGCAAGRIRARNSNACAATSRARRSPTSGSSAMARCNSRALGGSAGLGWARLALTRVRYRPRTLPAVRRRV